MKYLNIVSIFPALTETFVLRELRIMRQMGCEVVIGQLRPAGRTPTTPDFEDLRPSVVPARPLSWPTLAGLFFFAVNQPKKSWTGLKLVLASFPDIASTLKLAYILLASLGLAYRLRRSGIGHVRGHHLHSEAVSAMLVGGFLGVPYSFTCHTVKTCYPRSILREVVRQADFIVANIYQVKEFLPSLGAAEGQVHLIRNGVVLEQFPVRPTEPAAETPVILAVGRLDYKKGFHVLISACARLRDQGVRFRCVIVGDGDEWNALLARRKALRLEEQIELPGSLGFPEVQQWYERATLLAVPSVIAPDDSTDGLPTVIIEAFARGVPVVGTATGGIPEVVHHGVNGFVVAAGSERELARRIKELLLNEDLRRRFAIEARRTAEREFDLDRNLQTLAGLLHGQDSQQSEPEGSMVLDHVLGK